MEEAALNTIVSKYMEKYSVATIGVPDDHILLFPETGFFTFPLMVALALVPKTLEKSYEDQIKRQLMSYSVGINEDNCNRVVIPASLSEVNEEAVIIEGIKYYRKISIETAQNVHKLRSLVVEMYEKVGLKVGAI